MPWKELLIAWAVMLIPSLIAAELASGGRGTWLWGILGPAGWIVAALRGVQLRIEDAWPAARPAPDPVLHHHTLPALRGARRRRRRERELAARESAATEEAPEELSEAEAEPPSSESDHELPPDTTP